MTSQLLQITPRVPERTRLAVLLIVSRIVTHRPLGTAISAMDSPDFRDYLEFPDAFPYLSEPDSREPGYVDIKEKEELRSGRGPVSKSSEIPTVPQRYHVPVSVPEPVPYPDAGGTRKDDQAAREDKGAITRGSATPSSTGDEPGTCPPKCPDRQK